MSLNSEEKNTAYEKLTPQRKQLVDKVMENLEKGNLFWTQGWVSSGAPESAITGKKYRGINNLFLSLIAMSENYGDNRWATFKQMEEKGWTFKKDEEGNSFAKGKGASIEYYEMRDKETKRRFDRSVLDGMTASEQQEYMDKNDDIKRSLIRRDIEFVVDDGNKTNLSYKGEGIKSLITLALLNKVAISY